MSPRTETSPVLFYLWERKKITIEFEDKVDTFILCYVVCIKKNIVWSCEISDK